MIALVWMSREAGACVYCNEKREEVRKMKILLWKQDRRRMAA